MRWREREYRPVSLCPALLEAGELSTCGWILLYSRYIDLQSMKALLASLRIEVTTVLCVSALASRHK